MPITATSRLSGGPLRCEVSLEGDHVVATGEPQDKGGDASAPSPQQLLAAALASCISTTIQMYASRKGWDVGDARVDVAYHTDPRAPRFEVAVHMAESLSGEQRDRVLHIASRCPVGRVLQAGADVSHRAL